MNAPTGLLDITTDTLKRDLGVEVPEIYVVIAKHSVLGMDAESIRELLQCSQQELKEVESTEEYKQTRQYVAGRYAQQGVDQTTGWDQIEQIAINNLVKRLPYEKDGDFLLRVAAVANKAQRRHQKATGVLDPSIQGGRTVITLTQRLTQRLSSGRNEETEEVRQLSISDGSMSNPSFAEVDSLLSVSNKPVLSRKVEIQTHSVDPTMDELMRFLE